MSKPLIVCGAGEDCRDVRLNQSRIRSCRFNGKGNVRQQVALADDHCLACAEHFRILTRFVIAFCCAKHDDSKMFTQIMRCRAHQIANVLNEQEIRMLAGEGGLIPAGREKVPDDMPRRSSIVPPEHRALVDQHHDPWPDLPRGHLYEIGRANAARLPEASSSCQRRVTTPS
jgi:hypothetical protein